MTNTLPPGTDKNRDQKPAKTGFPIAEPRSTSAWARRAS
jgi:hypothetical protein